MKKVSIIIPVHNSSAYLTKCLDSCLSQTLEDIEIIAIDDCSTDSCPTILREYEQKYPEKFKAIYLTKNIRQGGARNVGIREAKGEYLAFVDSDDWIESEMCEKMYAASGGADMVGADYFISDENGDHKRYLDYTKWDSFHTNIQRGTFLKQWGPFWTRLYRRDFLLEHELYFPENIFYEDAWFKLMTALYAKRIERIQLCFYHYFQSPISTVRSKNDVRQYERIAIAEKIWEDCQKRGLYRKHKDTVELKYLMVTSTNILYILRKFDNPDISQLRKIRKNLKTRMPMYKKTEAYMGISTELKKILNLTVFSPRLTVFIYKHHLNNFRLILSAIKYRIKKICYEIFSKD